MIRRTAGLEKVVGFVQMGSEAGEAQSAPTDRATQEAHVVAPPGRPNEAPWRRLPPAIAQALAPHTASVAEDIIRAIRRDVPEYRRPLDGPFGQALRLGVEEALRRFLAMIGSDQPAAGENEVYVQLGRAEARSGRGIDALLAAYRVGARVAWRRFAEIGTRAGVAPSVLYDLAESIFAYIDELSAESIEGYALEQADSLGERQQRRQRLLTLLLADAPEPSLVRAAAEQCGWRLPETIAVVLTDARAVAVSGRLGERALVAQHEEFTCAIVADPSAPGARAELVRALATASAVVGPEVGVLAAARSYEGARRLLPLVRSGALGGAGGPLFADEHPLALLLAADRDALARVTRRAFRAFAGLPERSRERLERTLAAWLAERGRIDRVAKRLGVHPQTVRYRLSRLRELLGPELEDPQARLELELALRAKQLGLA